MSCFFMLKIVHKYHLIRKKSTNNALLTHLSIHQMLNTKIRLIIFFAAKDGEAPYSQ